MIGELLGAVGVVAYQPKGEAFMGVGQRPKSLNNELWLVEADRASRMVVENVIQV